MSDRGTNLLKLLDGALAEIERLQAKLDECKNPGYSAEQLANFEESCVGVPKLFIEWHWLPDLPEPDPGDWCVQVEAAIIHSRETLAEWQEVRTIRYVQRGDKWFFMRNGCERKIDPLDIAGWYYEPDAAPPKPLGESPTVDGVWELGEVENET